MNRIHVCAGARVRVGEGGGGACLIIVSMWQDSAIYKYFIIIMNQDSATAEVKCTILLNAKELDLN